MGKREQTIKYEKIRVKSIAAHSRCPTIRNACAGRFELLSWKTPTVPANFVQWAFLWNQIVDNVLQNIRVGTCIATIDSFTVCG